MARWIRAARHGVGAPRAGAAVAAAAAVCALLAACGSLTGPTASPRPAWTPGPTRVPAYGLTWAMAPDVERPADAFAIPSNPPTGPANPGTAGHPGHFPGQAVLADVAVRGDRLVAVGYVGLEGRWRARAWSSSDGLSWTVHPIDERVGSFAVAIAVAPDGTFVAVGRAGREAAAWRSPDGVAWERSTVGSLVADGADRPASAAERMAAVLATADGLLAGGSAGPELGERRARLWRSVDGATWTPVSDDPATFVGAEVAAITEVTGGYVALGRLGSGARPTGSLAWTSDDGRTWQRVDDPALAGGLAVAIVATPAGVLAVGSDADEREAVAWSSADGRSWVRAPGEPARSYFGGKIRMTDVVATPSGFVGVGNYVGLQFGTGTSWLSRDGLAWAQAPDQPTLGQGEPMAVARWADRLVIVGSRGAPDNYIPTVWLSPGLP